MEKMSHNRHRHSTTNQHLNTHSWTRPPGTNTWPPTAETRQPKTNNNHRQRHLTICSQHSTIDTRQPVTNNYCITDIYDRQSTPTPDNGLLTRHIKKNWRKPRRPGWKQNPFSWIPFPTLSSIMRYCLLQTDNTSFLSAIRPLMTDNVDRKNSLSKSRRISPALERRDTTTNRPDEKGSDAYRRRKTYRHR